MESLKNKLSFGSASINPEILLVGTAVFVGVGTGLGAIVFIWLLDQIHRLQDWSFDLFGNQWGLLISMAVAGLVVGYIVDRWAKEAKGHGVPEVMEAVVMRGGRIRPRVAAIKVLASSITIGAGGSAGREGPIVQVGAALGSTVGQWLKFSDERTRTLVACGAAAGIAATFNAPIAGSIFALEVILGRFTVRYFGAVVISAVSASIVGRTFLGNKPAFDIPAYPLNSLLELPIYIILGVLSAVVAIIFIRVLYKAEDIFDEWTIPQPVKASVGMVLTGLVAMLLPGREVLGPGLELIGEIIAEDFNLTLTTLTALLILKMVATTFTLGAGNSGGVFAPGLYMGAILGGIVGTIGHQFWPEVVVHPGAYAIVGMAAVFSGMARAPITAILIVFEMSGDYKLILPLMLATVLSTLIAEYLFEESIYTLKLKMKGVSLDKGRDEDILHSVDVSEVMSDLNDFVRPESSIIELLETLGNTHHHGLPVICEDNTLWGVVTLTDIDKARLSESTTLIVTDIGTPRSKLVTAYPDESIGEALRLMSARGLGHLPVVDREDHTKLHGFIRREDIIRAYDIALIRKAEVQHRAKRTGIKNLDSTEFFDMTISQKAKVVGKTVEEIAHLLPEECVLISVRRSGKILIPHGDTKFQTKDQVSAFLHTKNIDDLKDVLS
ncbi:MAG: CIC family chloride channel protein [Cellvibrionaceae bacterium]|jgi:CIC family chloride channel protein